MIIGFVWPEPTSSAAGERMLQLIELFQSFNYNLHFASAANSSDKTFDLKSKGIKKHSIALNHSSFDEFILQINPDVVLFDRFMTEEQYGWRVAEQCPNAIRILDTEDFHGLRKAREQALKAKVEVSIKHLQNDTTKRELASMYRCDLSLIISEAEIEVLRNQLHFEADLLHYIPFLISPQNLLHSNKLPKYSERQHFITVGNFRHPPNYDALLYLKQEIWPFIREQLPEAELHVYGAYESQKVTQLHNEKEGFLIKGYVEDIHAVMKNAKVCLAPLRFGAGLKGKIVDALTNGTPCVMTPIAAEGMFGELLPNGFINDDALGFAKNAVDLYTSTDLWEQSSKNGFISLKLRFDKAEHTRTFKKALQHLEDNLETHRQQNFIGQMLQHQTLQSTKYMSKWIEEKNR
nr:glycosyltransferase [Winogradskyella sp. DF17]